MGLNAVEGLFGSFSHYLYGITPEPNRGMVGKFINKINEAGVAHNHLFLATILYKGLQSEEYDMLSLFCHSATLPSLNVMTGSYRENEAHYEVPYGISHEPVTLTFYGDANLKIKAVFDNWYNSITQSRAMNPNGNNRLKFMDDFTCDIVLSVLDKSTQAVYSITLKGAWPKSVGGLDMSHQNTEVVSFPVQFVYERLEIITSANPLDASVVRPASGGSFPLNIINNALGAAKDLIQSTTGGIIPQIAGAIGTAVSINKTIQAVRILTR